MRHHSDTITLCAQCEGVTHLGLHDDLPQYNEEMEEAHGCAQAGHQYPQHGHTGVKQGNIEQQALEVLQGEQISE